MLACDQTCLVLPQYEEHKTRVVKYLLTSWFCLDWYFHYLKPRLLSQSLFASLVFPKTNLSDFSQSHHPLENWSSLVREHLAGAGPHQVSLWPRTIPINVGLQVPSLTEVSFRGWVMEVNHTEESRCGRFLATEKDFEDKIWARDDPTEWMADFRHQLVNGHLLNLNGWVKGQRCFPLFIRTLKRSIHF